MVLCARKQLVHLAIAIDTKNRELGDRPMMTKSMYLC
jgi:hypothetical protein